MSKNRGSDSLMNRKTKPQLSKLNGNKGNKSRGTTRELLNGKVHLAFIWSTDPDSDFKVLHPLHLHRGVEKPMRSNSRSGW
jgi:hypothetical protein